MDTRPYLILRAEQGRSPGAFETMLVCQATFQQSGMQPSEYFESTGPEACCGAEITGIVQLGGDDAWIMPSILFGTI